MKIIFTASPHWFSRCIRWLTRSPVSHVMIEYPSNVWGGQWIVEATVGGVRKVPSYKARHHIYAEFEILFDGEAAAKKVAEYVGEKYDYSGIAIFAIAIIIWRLFKKRIKKPYRSSKSQFCSEFAARWMQLAELSGSEDWDPESIHPKQLLKYCFANPKYFKDELCV